MLMQPRHDLLRPALPLLHGAAVPAHFLEVIAQLPSRLLRNLDRDLRARGFVLGAHTAPSNVTVGMKDLASRWELVTAIRVPLGDGAVHVVDDVLGPRCDREFAA